MSNQDGGLEVLFLAGVCGVLAYLTRTKIEASLFGKSYVIGYEIGVLSIIFIIGSIILGILGLVILSTPTEMPVKLMHNVTHINKGLKPIVRKQVPCPNCGEPITFMAFSCPSCKAEIEWE